MNIKIKAAGVYCLISDDYNRIYTALRKKLGDGEMQIFTERTPGHEYLQWELPGDQWASLADCDPLMASMVKSELNRRTEAIRQKFGDNAAFAQQILSYPDDGYVYYRPKADGTLDIKLTAWGYRYPERIDIHGGKGKVAPKTVIEPVSIQIVYDGQPQAFKTFKLNGYNRVTDGEGKLLVGDLPVGYQFDLEADQVKKHITVLQGEGAITVDLTRYGIAEVRVLLNGAPAEGVAVNLQYNGQAQTLTTDVAGHCSAKFVLSDTGGPCMATVDGEVQEKAIGEAGVVFEFAKTTPAEVKKVEEEKVVKGPVRKEVRMIVNRGGLPHGGETIHVICGGEQLLSTNDQGIATCTFTTTEAAPMCIATVEDNTQIKDLTEPLTEFVFDMPPLEEPTAHIEVDATLNGKPYAGGQANLHYRGQDTPITLDEQGHAELSVPFDENDKMATATLDGSTISYPLVDGLTKFSFDLERTEEPEQKRGWLSYLWEILLALLILLLVILTYLFGNGALFH